MNFLGHLYLSGKNEKILCGNFIGDFVKGNKHNSYPHEIQQGILLHRAIDAYTDNNKHWKALRAQLKPVYGLYAGVVADLFIDHVLAANWNYFSETRLDWFAKWTYASLLHNYSYLPDRVKEFLPYLIQHRRLQSYASINGIETSLKIMSLRTSLPDYTKKAIQLLQTDKALIQNNSMAFLEEISIKFGKID
ncbi:MAG TPA: ACP phosphodiesterase [Prolixibacteraceae bacterium]|nr:ACP phosphodiesterase [Prolixibacteraceae bacterium]